MQFYDLIKIEKEGKWEKEKYVHILTLKVELHLRVKKVKAQALNFWRLNFLK
jgi:hypothetical protein